MAENQRDKISVRLVSDEKIAETSSKGNQEKWQENGRWYKLDQYGYEALSETAISALLEESNIEKDFPFTFVKYRMEKINVHGRCMTGCSSENFLHPDENIITLSRLFKNYYTKPMKEILMKLPNDRARYRYIVEAVEDITGLEEFNRYFALLMEVDSLFVNDDRHLNNIAVLEKQGSFSYCPIFDNGAGLLSNMIYSPMDIQPKALISALRARPVNTTFNRQVTLMRSLYGRQLDIPEFTRKQIFDLLSPMLEYYPERDRLLLANRIAEVIHLRQTAMRK